MRFQGKCVEVLFRTEPPPYKQEVQGLRYKLLSASVPAEGTDFCLLEVIITVHCPSNQELGDFDRKSEDGGGLKGKMNERRE